MKAYIFHGIEGHPQENWFPWLKDELNKIGIPTEVPQFSNTNFPDRDIWLKEAGELNIDQDTILIGHSLGAVLALRMLEAGHKAKAVYLTAPFLNDLGWPVLKDSKFFADSFDWEKIKSSCAQIEVMGSINDPYVPTEQVREVGEQLGTKAEILDVYKHFNMTEFPHLLEKIKLLK
jgi:predicted alpha/beta hydrolase family esterase